METASLTGSLDPEAELARRASQGEEAAFEEIVRRHGDAVYRVVAAYVGRQEAEDAAQEVFVQVCAGIGRFEGRARLGTWVHRIAINVGLKRLRRRRRKPDPQPLTEQEPGGEEVDPLARLTQEERREAFHQALAALSEEHRAVIVLRGLEGLSFEEVSRILGIPVPTAQSRLARAKDRLRVLLEGHAPGGAATKGRGA